MKAAASALACLGVSAMAPAGAQAQALQKVRFSINPGQLVYLPLFLAVDRGYFKAAGLDVEVLTYKGSANTQMPLLARGDIDIGSVVTGPAMFNQFSEGFNIKLVSVLTEPKPGYKDGVSLVVRKDLWDSGAIRKVSDLKGRKVDGAAEGNPIDFLVRHTVASAGLKRGDVTLSYKPRSASDTPELLRQKVIDVAGASEPTATLIESQGIGVRWLSYKDVTPWYQETFLASSEPFLRDKPDAARRFLSAYLKAANEVGRTQGKWSPELLAVAHKWTGMPEDLLKTLGGVPYWPLDGRVRLDSLARVQQFWVEAGLVKKPIPVEKIVDTSALQSALEGERKQPQR